MIDLESPTTMLSERDWYSPAASNGDASVSTTTQVIVPARPPRRARAVDVVAYLAQEARWRSVVADVRGLLELPPDWDSYGGEPVDLKAAHEALRLLRMLIISGVQPPLLDPSSEGGVRMEWYRGGLELIIEIPPDDPPTLFFRELQTNEIWEGLLTDEDLPLGQLLARLA